MERTASTLAITASQRFSICYHYSHNYDYRNTGKYCQLVGGAWNRKWKKMDVQPPFRLAKPSVF